MDNSKPSAPATVSDTDFVKPVAVLKQRLAGLQTGRASPALLQSVKVDGSPLTHIASVSTAGRVLEIKVWNPTLTPKVVKAIQSSNLGLTPQTTGTVIRLPVPPLSEERRSELIKVAKSLAEEARVAIRMVRQRAMKATENGQKRVEEQTVAAVSEVNKLLASKTTELSNDQ